MLSYTFIFKRWIKKKSYLIRHSKPQEEAKQSHKRQKLTQWQFYLKEYGESKSKQRPRFCLVLLPQTGQQYFQVLGT